VGNDNEINIYAGRLGRVDIGERQQKVMHRKSALQIKVAPRLVRTVTMLTPD
jgi:hypothetical protein